MKNGCVTRPGGSPANTLVEFGSQRAKLPFVFRKLEKSSVSQSSLLQNVVPVPEYRCRLLANLLSVPVMGSIVVPAAVVAALLAPFGLDASDPAFWDKGLSMIAGFIDELEAME